MKTALFICCWVLNIFFLYECGERAQDYFQVEPRRHLAGVFDVELLSLLGRELSRLPAFFDLPQPREARGAHEPFDIFVARETFGLVEGAGHAPGNP